jgi:hypothetical protein
MSAQEINELFNRRVLTYNPETQRPLKRKEFNDKIIERIDVNPKAVKKIKNLILKGGFIPKKLLTRLMAVCKRCSRKSSVVAMPTWNLPAKTCWTRA